MPNKKVVYFAYGANMSTKWLQKSVPSAKPIGRAKLPNKHFICNKKSKDGSAKANLTDSTGDTVWGVLYQIDPAELGRLDKAEGGYKRLIMDMLTDDGSSIEAYVYVSCELTDDTRPYDWYKKTVIEGAREHQLPPSYVKSLEQIPSKPDLRK
jgi:gamma-glutamylcyclotransferase